jgi:hypothetical protein
MTPFLLGFLTCLRVFFRSRYNLGLEIFACAWLSGSLTLCGWAVELA